MRIKSHGAQGVTVDLTPADCLYLARACGLAGNCACEGDQKQLEGPFDLGAAYFEALALIAFAYGPFEKHGDDMREWTIERAEEVWGWVSAWQHKAATQEVAK